MLASSIPLQPGRRAEILHHVRRCAVVHRQGQVCPREGSRRRREFLLSLACAKQSGLTCLDSKAIYESTGATPAMYTALGTGLKSKSKRALTFGVDETLNGLAQVGDWLDESASVESDFLRVSAGLLASRLKRSLLTFCSDRLRPRPLFSPLSPYLSPWFCSLSVSLQVFPQRRYRSFDIARPRAATLLYQSR